MPLDALAIRLSTPARTARRAALSLLPACALLLLASTAHAQQSSGITGRVTDETGGALPGVTVHVHAGEAGRQEEQTVVTDETGTYRLQGLPSGPAQLELRLINFTVVQRNLVLQAGQTSTFDAVMRLSLRADVVVTASRTFRNIADVEDPAQNLVGIASAASQGAVTANQLAARPIMRSGEVLETVPGMVVSQHSGEGKANQYYLRGFNLDHGTDFSMTVAGVPVNMPTGAHAHGYADANFLIPELVSGVQFKKGPYYAEEGDFSAAGASAISYANVLDRSIATISGGNLGWGRVLAAASPRLGNGNLLGAVELTHNNGPWTRKDHYQRVNGVVRYSQGDTRNGFSVTGVGYWADWNATDQVPRRAIDSGLISRFGNIDPTDTGRSERQSLAFELQRSRANTSTRASAWLLHNELALFSNFTYFLDDPDNGDQFEQSEDRVAMGGRVTHRRLAEAFGRHTENAVGVTVRRDDVEPVGLYRTARGSRLATTRQDQVGQTMFGAYAQSEIEWTRSLRTTLGVRADVYQFDVDSSLAENSGNGSDAMVSPKFTAVLGPWSGTELYVNAGMGFHSNDARGATIRIDPSTGDPADPVTPLVRAKGAEFGLRTVAVRGLQSTVSVWYLGLDSELLFVGDAGTTEAGRPSRRMGVEWTNYARIRPWLTADADVSFSRARFRDDDPAGQFVPGALDRVIAAGLSVDPSSRLSASLRVRHFGPRPLIEDASVTSNATTLWNGEAGYRFSPRARLVLQGFNLFNADAADIDYFYTSRLPGEPAEGVDDIHTHPALPRSARVALQLSF